MAAGVLGPAGTEHSGLRPRVLLLQGLQFCRNMDAVPGHGVRDDCHLGIPAALYPEGNAGRPQHHRRVRHRRDRLVLPYVRLDARRRRLPAAHLQVRLAHPLPGGALLYLYVLWRERTCRIHGAGGGGNKHSQALHGHHVLRALPHHARAACGALLLPDQVPRDAEHAGGADKPLRVRRDRPFLHILCLPGRQSALLQEVGQPAFPAAHPPANPRVRHPRERLRIYGKPCREPVLHHHQRRFLPASYGRGGI